MARDRLQHVGQRGGFVRVGIETCSTQAGAERGVVDGDDRVQAGLVVGAEHDLFVTGLILVGKPEDVGHFGDS